MEYFYCKPLLNHQFSQMFISTLRMVITGACWLLSGLLSGHLDVRYILLLRVLNTQHIWLCVSVVFYGCHLLWLCPNVFMAACNGHQQQKKKGWWTGEEGNTQRERRVLCVCVCCLLCVLQYITFLGSRVQHLPLQNLYSNQSDVCSEGQLLTNT